MPDSIAQTTDLRFGQKFNRDSFVFDHELHHHRLYDIDSLIGLARRLGPASAYWSTRAANVADGWEDNRAHEQTLEDAIAGIEQSDTLVILKNMEQDPVFGPIFGKVVEDMAARVGPALEHDNIHGRGTILISSPRRVTAYHIDADANFLLQLRGEKTVYVFDGTDRNILPEPEVEAFYAGRLNAARYRAEHQAGARAVDFRPGVGVHVPVEWPHWVKNGESMSVSISINYDLRSNAQRARVFRANHRLRRFGLSPAAPGISPWRDMGKIAFVKGLDRLHHHTGRG
jgi:hypothetical protein